MVWSTCGLEHDDLAVIWGSVEPATLSIWKSCGVLLSTRTGRSAAGLAVAFVRRFSPLECTWYINQRRGQVHLVAPGARSAVLVSSLAGISSVEPDAFSDMENLHELELQNTRLSSSHLQFVNNPEFRAKLVST